MKKLILILITLSICVSNLYSKEYSYQLASDVGAGPLLISPRAWGKLDHDGRFFWGENGRTDGWGKRGPLLLSPGEQLNFKFLGEWCHGALRVVEANRVSADLRRRLKSDDEGTRERAFREVDRLMTEIPIYKSDQEMYDQIVEDATKAAIVSSAATAGASGALIFAGIRIADWARQNLCGDWHFLILKNDKNEYVGFARPM